MKRWAKTPPELSDAERARDKAIKAIASCLRHPEECETMADYMRDMGDDARRWLDSSTRSGIEKDIELHAKMVRENDLAENMLRALATLAREGA